MSLRPFAEVRREQGAERFLAIAGQQVYIEQQGRGEPVVLLHGFGSSSYCWRRVMPELARSFRVVALDLNGFGYTERPKDPRSYTREGQERLILSVMDALGIARAHLVGHSYGGGLTLFLAARHPERLRSMVLVDSSAPTYPDDRRSPLARVRPLNALYLRYALRPEFIQKTLRNSFFDASLATPELARAYLDRLRVEGEEDAYYGLTVSNRRPPVAVELGKIDVPALIVWGSEDRLIQPDDGRRAARRLPRATFVAIPNTGHLPMEERPEEWLGIVLPFLASQSEAPCPAAGEP